MSVSRSARQRADSLGRRGAFAVVKKCKERSTGRHWAVKLIAKAVRSVVSLLPSPVCSPGTIQGVEDQDALWQEVKVLQGLDHPNIVKLHVSTSATSVSRTAAHSTVEEKAILGLAKDWVKAIEERE